MNNSKEKITLIDVRSQGEFMMGHVEGSLNIPLHEIPARVAEIKSMNGTVYLCCASGNRSGQAEMYLRQHGLTEVHNAGSWLDAEEFLHSN
ncbi:MAG: rhodanese-like domain-containing protein [Flavobacteriales bacterium]|nr:rhodanese-like domain-containing protein [Flavobacteriales bacterium]